MDEERIRKAGDAGNGNDGDDADADKAEDEPPEKKAKKDDGFFKQDEKTNCFMYVQGLPTEVSECTASLVCELGVRLALRMLWRASAGCSAAAHVVCRFVQRQNACCVFFFPFFTKDFDEQKLWEYMKKAGIVAEDDEGQPKVKLYKNADGSLKGDGM